MQMGEMLDEEGNFTVRNLITEDTSPDFIPDYCDDTRFQTVVYHAEAVKENTGNRNFVCRDSDM